MLRNIFRIWNSASRDESEEYVRDRKSELGYDHAASLYINWAKIDEKKSNICNA